MARTPGARRNAAKLNVRDWLLARGPATLLAIARGTGLTPSAVSKALRDIRSDPAYEYATIATASDGFRYRIAVTAAEMRAGLVNQMRHTVTRAESAISAAAKMTTLASTPDEYAEAADLAANSRMMKAQAEAILRALGA